MAAAVAAAALAAASASVCECNGAAAEASTKSNIEHEDQRLPYRACFSALLEVYIVLRQQHEAAGNDATLLRTLPHSEYHLSKVPTSLAPV